MTSRRTRLPSGTAARLSSCAGGASAGMMVSGAFIGSAGGAPGGLSLLRGRRAAVEQRLGPVADDREARPIIGMRRLLRSEERRVGKEWVRTVRSRWSPYK